MEEKIENSAAGVSLQKREWKKGDILLDCYEIQDIKRGGMGIVYIALNKEWNQMFAIKTFKPKYLWDEDAINRFIVEAETWTNLERHTNIVFANFVQKIEGVPCIFLEYIDGGDLSQWIGRLDIPRILDFAIQFCNGMDYAYKKLDIIHRDIKPQNAMITSEGVLKVTDFGLAKAAGERILKEESGLGCDAGLRISGTWPYMPPEQFPEEIQKKFHFLPKPLTMRSDVYSFGVTFYQVLTGRLPFYTWDAIFTQEPVNPAAMKPDVPKQLDLLLMKCLEKNPVNRKSFAELMEQLIGIYNGLSIEQKIFEKKYIVKGKKETLTAGDWSNKGTALYNLGRYQEALDCYNKALDINPRFAKVWGNKGVPLGKLGRYQEELDCYDKALEVNPRLTEEVWDNKGIALGKLGRYQEAIACCDKAIDINPRDAQAWNNKGLLLNSLERFEEAIACCDKAIDINPRDAETWNIKGLVLRKLGRFEEAIACCDRALEIDPRYAVAWYTKGIALDNLGKMQEALTCYDKAIDINPRFAEVWYTIGIALDNLGRMQEAIACYDKALEINPRCTEAWYSKGAALFKLDSFQEAIACCDKALEINPRCTEAWNNKGAALFKLDSFQEAIACCDKALEINPRDAEALYNKGIALNNLGRFQEARYSLQRFIEFAPPQYASHVKKVEELIRQLKEMV